MAKQITRQRNCCILCRASPGDLAPAKSNIGFWKRPVATVSVRDARDGAYRLGAGRIARECQLLLHTVIFVLYSTTPWICREKRNLNGNSGRRRTANLDLGEGLR